MEDLAVSGFFGAVALIVFLFAASELKAMRPYEKGFIEILAVTVENVQEKIAAKGAGE